MAHRPSKGWSDQVSHQFCEPRAPIRDRGHLPGLTSHVPRSAAPGFVLGGADRGKPTTSPRSTARAACAPGPLYSPR